MMRRTPIKRNKPKARAGHDKSMLDACRGERCFLCVPFVCLSVGGIETVVPCHSNQSKHGKGMGIKARDQFTVPGCMACHAWLDQGPAPRELKNEIWDLAYAAWETVRDQKLNAVSAAYGRQKETATSSGLQSLSGR